MLHTIVDMGMGMNEYGILFQCKYSGGDYLT